MPTPFVLPTIPRWRLLLTADGVIGLHPDGQKAFDTNDLGTVLDALDPADLCAESVALCTAALLGVSPSSRTPVAVIAPPDTQASLTTLATLHGFVPSEELIEPLIAAYVLAVWPTVTMTAALAALSPRLPFIMVHPASLPDAVPSMHLHPRTFSLDPS